MIVWVVRLIVIEIYCLFSKQEYLLLLSLNAMHVTLIIPCSWNFVIRWILILLHRFKHYSIFNSVYNKLWNKPYFNTISFHHYKFSCEEISPKTIIFVAMAIYRKQMLKNFLLIIRSIGLCVIQEMKHSWNGDNIDRSALVL